MENQHRAARRGCRFAAGLLLGALLIPGAPPALAARQAEHEENATPAQHALLDLYRGEIRLIDVPGRIKRIAIGDGSLVTANVVDGRLMLLAEKAGVTSLVAWTANGIALNTTVRVAKGNVRETAAQLREVLAIVPDVKVIESGPNILLTGTVHRDMLGRIKAATAGVPNLVNAIAVDEGDALKKTIHFKVRIMELTRNAQENLGIEWDRKIAGPQAGAQGYIGSQAVAGPGMVIAGISTHIASTLNLMITRGDAYVLAAPELNTKSGGTASFLAGGQVPIPRAGALGTTDVEYKDYGIKLDIKPVVDANNVISAQIDTEISQIDPSVSYGGYPGFLTRSARSDISLRAGETMAISGLVNADAIGNMSRLPFLGRLPIIGRLFRSDEFRSKRSDLVIFVTPMISDPTLAPNTDLLARADRIDRGFHQRHGDPSPLAERDRARGKDEARQAIGPTRPQPAGPLRAQAMQDDRGDASGSPVSSRVPPRQAPAPTRPARGEAASFGPASPSAQRRLLDGIDAPAQGSLPRNGAPPPPVAEPVTIPATPIEWHPAKVATPDSAAGTESR
ncbi:type II and III secretion system protein family protein [Burkholderia gladioli]|uniref:type II and III secretion system protein family protein n=1 Tax=Burkholderia gladioli TaxID=28095 RepID=UPI00164006DE|nr:pilus assembly protein N-terminal domain-containing protein [Burkholderia gladioli]